MSIEILAERGLPASAEAERAILGAILLDNSCAYQAIGTIRADDFSLDSHRRIFLRMDELARRDAPIDFVTLTEIIGQHKEIESVGGVAYVTSLTDGLPRVKNIEQYVKIVKDKSMLRQLIHASTSMMQRAYEQEAPAEEIVNGAQDSLLRLVNDHYKEQTIESVVRTTLNNLEELRRHSGECIGWNSGHQLWDEATTGYREKEVTIMGGRPGMGKTAWMCQGIRANLLRNEKVGCISSEVPAEQIILRLACLETGIHVFDTRDPRMLPQAEYNRLQEAIAFFASDFEGKFFIDDTPCIPIDQLCTRARAWASKGVGMLFGDHLHLFGAADGFRDDFAQVSNAIRRIWHLVRCTQQAICVLCQLKRIQGNERPTMADLRGCGKIEEFAQVIGLLWRELKFSDDGEGIIGGTGDDEIILAKQRSGPANIVVDSTFEAEVGKWKHRVGKTGHTVSYI